MIYLPAVSHPSKY